MVGLTKAGVKRETFATYTFLDSVMHRDMNPKASLLLTGEQESSILLQLTTAV
jgi:hypothetical protein